jgi:hypothetical protein
MRKEFGEGEGAFRQRGFAAFEDFVADTKKVDRMRRVAPLLVGGRFFQEAKDALELVGCPLEFIEAFHQRLGGGGLILRLARFFEGVDDVEVGRGGALADRDEFGFFRGHDEASIALQFVAQGSPPPFGCARRGFGKRAIGEHGGEVIAEGFECEARIVIGDHAVDKFDRRIEGFLLHRGRIGQAPCLDVGLGHRGERGRGKRHLHGLLPAAEELEIELAEEKIRVGHARATPALVQGEGARGKLVQNFGLLLGEFSFVDRRQ